MLDFIDVDKALLKEMVGLIRNGNKPHRCRIAKGTLTYENPYVQKMKLATEAFERNPAVQTLETVKAALESCKNQGIGSYSYDQIEPLVESVSQVSVNNTKKNKI